MISAKPPALFAYLDKDYIPFFKVFVRSLRANAPDHPVLLLVAKELPSSLITWAQEELGHDKLELLDPIFDDSIVEGLPRPFNSCIMERIRILSEEFSSYGTIMHCDLDVVIRKSFVELLDTEEFLIAANRGEYFENCTTFADDARREDKELHRLCQRFSVSPDIPMANAGVFVVPEQLRTKEAYNELMELYDLFKPYLYYADQSLLSLWLAYKKIPMKLEQRWNFRPLLFNQDDVCIPREEIAIYHFTLHKPGTLAFRRWNLISEHALWLEEEFMRYADRGYRIESRLRMIGERLKERMRALAY